MELVWDFCRQIETATSGGATTSYFDESCQAFYIDNGYIKTQIGVVNEGQWQDTVYGPEVTISDSGYDKLDIEHHFNGSVFGSAKHDLNTVFFVYDYMLDLSGWLVDGKWVEQPDNPIKVGQVTIRNVDIQRMVDTGFTMFAPGNRITLRFRSGDSEYYDIGVFYLSTAPFDETTETFTLQGRNRIGHYLAEQTADELVSVSGTRTAIVTSILTQAGMDSTDYVLETDSATGSFSFEPDQVLMDCLSKLLTTWGWVIDDLPNGQVLIGSRSFVRTYKLTAVYEFTRDTDVVSIPATRSLDGVYTRAAIRRKVPARIIFGNVPYYDSWFLGAHKTYHATVDDSVSDSDMDALLSGLIAELQYMGVVENVLSPFRPWLQIGDVAVLTGGEEDRIVGIITNLTHKFGRSGFWTDIAVTSGGEVSNPGDPELVATRFAGKLGGANRERRLLDFLQQSAGSSTSQSYVFGGGGGKDGLSAYEVWRALGNTGTEQDFIDSLGVPMGGAAGAVMTKVSAADYDAAWKLNPFAKVSRSTAQTLTTAVDTAVSFTTEVVDNDTMVDIATYPTRITAITAGSYLVTAVVDFTADTTGARKLMLKVNGTTYAVTVNLDAVASGVTTAHLTFALVLVANDYIELFAYQNSGGDLDIVAGTAIMSMAKVG